jgi:cell division septation protein DedD
LDLSSDPVMGAVVPGGDGPSGDGPSGEELAQAWEAPAKKGIGGKIAGAMLAALLLSFGALGYIYHEEVLAEWVKLQTYLAGPSKSPPLSTLPVVAPSPPQSTVGMSSSNTPTPLKPADAVSTDQGEAVVAPVVAPVAAPKPTDVSSDKTVVAAAEKGPDPSAEKPAEKPAEKAANSSPQADDIAWIKQLQDDAWVMQHGAFDSLAEARTFQSSALGYKAGQVFFTRRKGSKPYFILITGPYAEKAQAENLMRQNPPLAKAWLRSAKSLKIQFQDEASPN